MSTPLASRGYRSARRAFVDWVVPPGFQRAWAAARTRIRMPAVVPEVRSITALRDRHAGARCFVLAAGPSINQQDLQPLRGELCISTSNFFVHKDYRSVAPQYHCVPNFCSPPFPELAAVTWFTEMHRGIGLATLITDLGNRRHIVNHGLFDGRSVHYIDTQGSWDGPLPDPFDLTQPMPPAQSVPIMAIMVAFYLGCREVYLLGCDHSWLDHYGESHHFYAERQAAWVAWGGEAWSSYGEELHSIHELWTQYEKLRAHAERTGRHIYNATSGGRLDVFERVSLEDVVRVEAQSAR
jgi:hypothetical protein